MVSFWIFMLVFWFSPPFFFIIISVFYLSHFKSNEIMLFNTKTTIKSILISFAIHKLQKKPESFYVGMECIFLNSSKHKSIKPWWHKLWSFYGKQLTEKIKKHKYKNPFESFSITSFWFFFYYLWVNQISHYTGTETNFVFFMIWISSWFHIFSWYFFMYFKENPCGKYMTNIQFSSFHVCVITFWNEFLLFTFWFVILIYRLYK